VDVVVEDAFSDLKLCETLDRAGVEFDTEAGACGDGELPCSSRVD
jgi:hypothetical protein